jgi:hypothetical protein
VIQIGNPVLIGVLVTCGLPIVSFVAFVFSIIPNKEITIVQIFLLLIRTQLDKKTKQLQVRNISKENKSFRRIREAISVASREITLDLGNK